MSIAKQINAAVPSTRQKPTFVRPGQVMRATAWNGLVLYVLSVGGDR